MCLDPPAKFIGLAPRLLVAVPTKGKQPLDLLTVIITYNCPSLYGGFYFYDLKHVGIIRSLSYLVKASKQSKSVKVKPCLQGVFLPARFLELWN